MTRSTILTLVAGALTSAAPADVIELEASQDNTLYEHAAGALSNGAGSHLYVGVTVDDRLRRGALRFDVAAALPAGSTISSATLVLTMNKTIGGAVDLSLHRFEAAWGEAGSTAVFGGGGGGGGGAAAMVGDVTWLYAFSPSVTWSAPGGDFAPTPSATLSVAGPGTYAFSSPALATEVQAWLDDPGTNFGWLIKDDTENLAAITAKRFSTRETSNAALRPRLEIVFSPPPGTTFCNSLPNATGSEALLTASGSPTSSLVFTSAPVPDTVGQFFYGTAPLGGGAMLGDGIRCVGGATQRILPFVTAGMMAQLPNVASTSVNYTAPYAAGLTGTLYFQHWFRSGLVTGMGSNSSSGLQVTF